MPLFQQKISDTCQATNGLVHLHTLHRQWTYLSLLLVFSGVLLAACTGPGGSLNSNGATATSKQVALAQLHWCSKPAMVFRDDASAVKPSAGEAAAVPSTSLGPANGTPVTLTSWSEVQANLGFTVFLPPTLPAGTCLLNVSGTLRHPVLGSNFVITYLLADHDSITFSQAPLTSKNTAFQCSAAPDANTLDGYAPVAMPTVAVSANQDPVQLCSGARNTTNIVFSARGKMSALQHIFQSLQPNVSLDSGDLRWYFLR